MKLSETVIQVPDGNSVGVCVHLGHMIQNEGRRLQAYMSCDSSLLSHAGMFIQPASFSYPCMHSCLSNTIHALVVFSIYSSDANYVKP